MTERRAVVTGGAGFIGGHLIDKLLVEGYSVTVLDRNPLRRTSRARPLGMRGSIRFVRGSITDKDAVRRALHESDVIFHHAALLSVVQSVEDPLLVDRINNRGTLLLLEEARRADAKRFIFASSAAVYGSSAKSPLFEHSALDPDSPYGASKIAGEGYCKAFFHSYGLETVVLRYFNVYGPRCRLGRFGGVMVKLAECITRGHDIEIFGDGNQTRDFVFVDDVVRANVVAARSSAAIGETFNIGTGQATSINELVEIFLGSGSAPRRVRVIHHKARAGEILHSVASIEKARRMMAYAPKTSVVEGVGKFMTWYGSMKSPLRSRSS